MPCIHINTTLTYIYMIMFTDRVVEWQSVRTIVMITLYAIEHVESLMKLFNNLQINM